MRRLVFLRPYALLSLILLIPYGCSGGRQPEGGQQRRGPGGRGNAPAVQVKTAAVQRVPFQRQVDLSGTLTSLDQVRVVSEVPGTVREVLFQLGTEVRTGQVLVRLDTRELELAAQRAESALRQTEAQLGMTPGSNAAPPDDQIAAIRTAAANRDDARAQLARAQELVSKGLLPKAELDTTQTRVKVTEAAHQAAVENVSALKASLLDRRAAYELAQKKLSDAVVRAPIDGAISERPIQRGEYIRENTPVAGITQIQPLKLVTAVQEKFSNVIRRDLRVQFRVESLPDQVFDGKIAFISPLVDQSTRTFPVEVLVDNANRKLKPGFFAKGAIFTERDENVLAVTEDAVSTLAGVSSVYVINDGVVKQQNVRLGSREGALLEIVEGLKGDEVLAASNLSALVSGMKVSTGEEGETGASEAIEEGAPGGNEGGTRRSGQRQKAGGS